MSEKMLDISEVKGAKANISDLKVYGDGDTFALLCKASSQDQGWMKSTKVCNLPNGCIVQVTTQQKNPDGSYAVAEALTFVPGINMDKTQEPRHLVGIKNNGTLCDTYIPNRGTLRSSYSVDKS
jgi:pyruvate/2-oxoglutarate dehydrogenase complex dihydrolipoamide acyltransferase (E2) component